MRGRHGREYNGPMESTEGPRVNRRVFSVVPLAESDDALAYWLTKTPQERLEGVEETRQALYGYEAGSGRIRRVLMVAKLGDQE